MNVCINVPSIVYQNSWLSQTSSIGSTNVYTPATDGLFRVSYGGKATISSGSSLDVEIGWVGGGQFYQTDPISLNFGFAGEAGDAIFGGVSVSFVSSGVPITFSAGHGGSNAYSVYVTIEQLQ